MNAIGMAAARIIVRHGIGEGACSPGQLDGEGDFRCWCGRWFEGEHAMREWAEHVVASLRRAGLLL